MPELEEIKALLSSPNNKSLAYSFLLHLQQQSTLDASLIHQLSLSSHSLLSSMISDISVEDEEIAARALRCLGFMIYHPALVDSVPAENAGLVLESLVKVITTTKLKSVCNLGVWCISIQQMSESVLAACFSSLSLAIVHALDNPFGSLSTTFEAMQAVIKLSTQLNERMKNTLDVWAPPMYRRLISTDKKERDVSERCLLKLKSTVFPPQLNLSKALVRDLKKVLLPGLNKLLNQGMKIQSIKAWEWYIRLLGSHAMENRHLINEILKIPEQTFSDHDPQVQIASLVAWEGLIDSLISCPRQACEADGATEICYLKSRTLEVSNKFMKRARLIMTPIIGIMSSKCDLSVRLTCIKTWCYLLSRLDKSVNHLSMVKAVLEPVFEVVFRRGPEKNCLWIWNRCIELLEGSISAKLSDVQHESYDLECHQKTSMPEISPGNTFLVKWLPWNVHQLEFYMKMFHMLVSPELIEVASPENRSLARDSALRMFRSVLKGVQVDLKKPSLTYDNIKLTLKRILEFLKKVCEDITSDESGFDESLFTSLELIEAVLEELDLSILGSPLYKLELDLKYTSYLKSSEMVRSKPEEAQGCFIEDMDLVSPTIYLAMLYLSVVEKELNRAPKNGLFEKLVTYLTLMLSSSNSLETLSAVLSLLYKNAGASWLKIWISVTKATENYLNNGNSISFLTLELDTSRIIHLLAYPFMFYPCTQNRLFKSSSPELVEKNGVEIVTEAWKSLFVSVMASQKSVLSLTCNFHENICLMLNKCIDENNCSLDCGAEHEHCSSTKDRNWDLSLTGNVLTLIIEHIIASDSSPRGNFDDHRGSIDHKHTLGLAARFMRLSLAGEATQQQCGRLVIRRVYSTLTRFLSNLRWKQDIMLFIEIISSPLLESLSQFEAEDEISLGLQLLWTKIVKVLQKSQPPIVFDSTFLKFQAPLLEKTLDHPNPSFSEPTISFWNSTYSQRDKLDYPHCLLHVLDKLSRTGRISLYKRSPAFLVKCQRNKKANGIVDYNYKPPLDLKRKRVDLTDHQKEVKRAQQGKERDCSGHGPGLRTYTSVDFSQGNDDSQESQDIRDPESILQMLRRNV